MTMPEFWEYWLELKDDNQPALLCLGERIKKGTLRPTITTIPSTQISGAIREVTGDLAVWAIGYLEDYDKELMIYAPRFRDTDVSKIPLSVQILRNVRGRVFVAKNGYELAKTLDISLGAFRTKGFGRCVLTRVERQVDTRIVEGELRSRLPERECERIGINGDSDVIKPIYGYLFRPNNPPNPIYSNRGKYERALFEGSRVRAYSFIVR
jgi:hypothetical protein